MVLVTQNAADSVAVEYRKVAVEDHDVHIDLPGLRQGGGPVVGDVNEIALAAQPLRERLGQVDLVVNNQYPHCPPPSSVAAITMSRRPHCR